MYESFYGFLKKPFSISPDPDFLFLNANYKEALALMNYGIEERKGIICLVGEVGTGKTMLLNKLLLSLDVKVTPVTIPFPKVSFAELLEYILDRLGIPVASNNVTTQAQALYKYLMNEREKGRTVALLVDEAQGLDVQTLEGLRLLSNMETPTEKLLQIILLGQPELKDKLNLTSLRQFKQRIAIGYDLKPLTSEEVPQYVAHRLKVVGYPHGLKLFSEEAIQLIFSYSRGIPRLINALCDNGLLTGLALRRKQIDDRIIHEAAGDLLLREAPPSPVELTPQEPLPASPIPTIDTQPERRSSHGWTGALIAAAAVAAFVTSQIKWPLMDYSSLINLFGTRGEVSRTVVETQEVPPQQATLQEKLPTQPSDGPLTAPTPSRVEPVSAEERVASTVTKAVPNAEAPATEETKQAPELPPGEAPKVPEMKETELAPPPGMESQSQKPSGTLPTPLSSIEEKQASSQAAGPQEAITTEAPAPPTAVDKPEAAPIETVQPLASKEPAIQQPAIMPTPSAEVSAEPSPVTPLSLEKREKQAPSPKLTASLEVPSNQEDLGLIRIVRKDETISEIAHETYGSADIYVLSLIQLANNPKITDIDFVLEGESLVLPHLKEGSLIFDQGEGRYMAFVGATRDPSRAKEWQSQLKTKGMSVEVVPVWLSGKVKVYRLQAEGFPSRSSAVEKLQAIVPLQFRAKTMGETL
jgi:general secretion pathway protein A